MLLHLCKEKFWESFTGDLGSSQILFWAAFKSRLHQKEGGTALVSQELTYFIKRPSHPGSFYLLVTRILRKQLCLPRKFPACPSDVVEMNVVKSPGKGVPPPPISFYFNEGLNMCLHVHLTVWCLDLDGKLLCYLFPGGESKIINHSHKQANEGGNGPKCCYHTNIRSLVHHGFIRRCAAVTPHYSAAVSAGGLFQVPLPNSLK